MEANTFECAKTTPFGAPVVPDVYMMTAVSVDLGGTGSHLFLDPESWMSDKACALMDFGNFEDEICSC